MKKITVLFLFLLLLGGLVSCKNDDDFIPNDDGLIDQEEYDNDVVTTKTTLAELTLENTFLTAKFDLDNGSLISLVNKKANTDYLVGKTGGSWAMVIDTTTANPFRTNYKSKDTVLVSSRNQYVEYDLNTANNSAIVTFTYDIEFSKGSKTYTGIQVIETVALMKGTQELTFDYEIKNDCSDDITICTFTGAQLSGLKDSANGKLNLFWPNKEGKIYESAIDKINNTTKTDQNLTNVYPGTCSMQLVQLYNNKESLYYFVKDPTREYKIANYGNFNYSGGYDFNGVGADEKISLSFTQFPFIGSGETKSVYQTVIGVAVNELWYKGADRYQQFLYEADMINDYENFVENWNGFIALVGSHYGSKHFSSYIASGVGEISYADWVAQADENSGVDTTLVLGWNYGGFDSMYPDYDFATGEGFNGEEGFSEMADLVHANGDLFCCHMNSRIADMDSNWSVTVADELTGLTNLQAAGVKRAGFTSETPVEDYEDFMVCETYGTGTIYYVMSSASKEFQEQMIAVVTRLRAAGCNGLWFDQLYERDAYLDYDESHRMSVTSTPATLYAEGYMAIFEAFDEIASTINSTEPWILVCGGQGGDYFAKWTDVYGGNWNRKLGAVDNTADSTIDSSGTENCDRHLMSPELIEYTVPARYIGQAGAGTLSGQDDEYARAFVFGSPFLAEQFTTSTQALIDIYDYYPDIFYKGIYKDKKALQLSTDIIASVILSKSQKAFAIQLYNYSSETLDKLSVYVSLAKLGITGEIESITDLFTGQTLEFKNNTFKVNLEACEFTSLYVTYK